MKYKLMKTVNRVVELPVDAVRPNPAQPRREFAEKELEQLAVSIRENGLLQPITVRRVNGEYQLISGERRLRAAKLAGLPSIQAIVMDTDSERSAVLALVENLHRQDLNVFEQAAALKALLEQWGVTQEQAAQKLNMAQSTIANKLRLLKLSPESRELILKYNLSERHARAVLNLKEEQQRSLLAQAGKHQWTVAKLEQSVEKLQKQKVAKKRPKMIIKDVRLFFNSFQKTVDAMEEAGIHAKTQQVEKEDCIQYIVTIPK